MRKQTSVYVSLLWPSQFCNNDYIITYLLNFARFITDFLSRKSKVQTIRYPTNSTDFGYDSQMGHARAVRAYLISFGTDRIQTLIVQRHT